MQQVATALVQGLVVNEERMLANLELTHGALFSQRVLLALVEGDPERGRAPMVRNDAYRIAQELAQRAWDEGTQLRELLAADERAAGLDLDAIFDYAHYTRYAAEVVTRLDEIA
jgi:adenylosuccinate lyase